MKLKIVINMENSAFEESAGGEVCRILERIMLDLRTQEQHHMVGYERKLLDVYGNSVGKAKVVP